MGGVEVVNNPKMLFCQILKGLNIQEIMNETQVTHLLYLSQMKIWLILLYLNELVPYKH